MRIEFESRCPERSASYMTNLAQSIESQGRRQGIIAIAERLPNCGVRVILEGDHLRIAAYEAAVKSWFARC